MRYDDNIIFKVYFFLEFNLGKVWGKNNVEFRVFLILKVCCSVELNVFKKTRFILWNSLFGN